MKKIENNFVVTGFVGKDAEIRQFTNASVARFPLAVSRLENNGEESKRVSAFMNFEAWRKNENTGSFDQLTKGTMLTVEGYFKPEEWSDQSGVKHNRIVMVSVKFYPLHNKATFGSLLFYSLRCCCTICTFILYLFSFTAFRNALAGLNAGIL